MIHTNSAASLTKLAAPAFRQKWLVSILRIIAHTSVPEVYLNLSQRLFLSVVVLTLVLTLSWINPWSVSLVAGLLSIVAIRAYARGQDLRLLRRRRLLLGVAGILVWLVIYLQFSTVLGQNAGIAAITILVTLKLFELDRRRDGLILLFLAQILVMGLFFVSQEILSALCAIVMEVMLFSGQRALFQSPLASWSWPWHGVAQSGKLLGLSLILGAFLFVVFPRPSEPIWQVGVSQTTNTTGLSDSMSPGSMDSLVKSNAIAFSIDMKSTMPSPSKRYWRGPSMTNYHFGKWFISTDSIQKQPQIVESVLRKFAEKNNIKLWRYTMYVEPHFRKWIIGLETTYRMHPSGKKQTDGLWLANKPINKKQAFQLVSLDTINDIEPNINSYQSLLRFAREPGYTEPQLRELANTWRLEALTKTGEKPLAKLPRLERYLAPLPAITTKTVINKALQYFSNEGFIYSLDNVRLPERNPMDAFLFDSKRGFCEAYAGAFTLLMRSAGIPARVVTGYQGGEFNGISGQWIIRQSDAHAWSEVWVTGEGWLRVDPTAAIAPERIESSFSEFLANSGEQGLLSQINNLTFLRQTTLLWEGAQTLWNRWVVLYDDQSQSSLLSKLSLSWLTHYQLLGIAGFFVLLFFVLVFWHNRPTKLLISQENIWWHAIIHQLQQRNINVNLSMPPNAVLTQVTDNKRLLKTKTAKLYFTTHIKNLQDFIAAFLKLKYQKLSPEELNENRQVLKRLRKKI